MEPQTKLLKWLAGAIRTAEQPQKRLATSRQLGALRKAVGLLNYEPGIKERLLLLLDSHPISRQEAAELLAALREGQPKLGHGLNPGSTLQLLCQQAATVEYVWCPLANAPIVRPLGNRANAYARVWTN